MMDQVEIEKVQSDHHGAEYRMQISAQLGPVVPSNYHEIPFSRPAFVHQYLPSVT